MHEIIVDEKVQNSLDTLTRQNLLIKIAFYPLGADKVFIAEDKLKNPKYAMCSIIYIDI